MGDSRKPRSARSSVPDTDLTATPEETAELKSRGAAASVLGTDAFDSGQESARSGRPSTGRSESTRGTTTHGSRSTSAVRTKVVEDSQDFGGKLKKFVAKNQKTAILGGIVGVLSIALVAKTVIGLNAGPSKGENSGMFA